MSGVITTSNHPKALWPGIHKWWGREYARHPEVYAKIFDQLKSTKAYEEDVEVTGFGLTPVKNQGAGVQYDSETQGDVKRYTHVSYGQGYIVSWEELMDNLYEVVSKRRSKALAFSGATTKETVHANILNRGFNPSYVGGDNKELFATDHPTVNGTESNELATPADLSEASLEDLCVQIMNAKNSRGLRIQLQPKNLIVAPANMFEAKRIIESDLQNDTANNAKNIVGGMFSGCVVWTFLSDSDAWFVQTNAPSGLQSFVRHAPEFTKDNDFDTNNAKAKMVERYSVGWTDWRGAYGSPGA